MQTLNVSYWLSFRKFLKCTWVLTQSIVCHFFSHPCHAHCFFLIFILSIHLHLVGRALTVTYMILSQKHKSQFQMFSSIIKFEWDRIIWFQIWKQNVNFQPSFRKSLNPYKSFTEKLKTKTILFSLNFGEQFVKIQKKIDLNLFKI